MSDHQNRLIHENSPYLLQHATNPVDWYPWSPAAFQRAREENKPVFLSIGYATCHWCHVMERESFQDHAVADLLNRDFISIKVDREQRPDIDGIYMQVCQMLTGSGGWPLTVIMSPDGEPFFATTYVPRTARMGRQGLLELLPRIADIWKQQPANISESIQRIRTALEQTVVEPVHEKSTELDPGRAFAQLSREFDDQHGGFGQAPKFPASHNLMFLLRYHLAHGSDRAAKMVDLTLDRLGQGGIYDHVDGGIHRYSTDREWHVPHFEKMLYDQAMIARTAFEHYRLRNNPDSLALGTSTLDYVLTHLQAPNGGFFSAEDADSPGGEGAFYTWTMEELQAELGTDDAARAAALFHCTPDGNFYDPEFPQNRRNVLHLAGTKPSSATNDTRETQRFVRDVLRRLGVAREKRERPFLDDKILTDWNGLMIHALTAGYHVTGKNDYLDAATRAAGFITEHLLKDQTLFHCHRKGITSIPGFLDDYAAAGMAFLQMYLCLQDPLWLERALLLGRLIVQKFRDPEAGGFYFVPDDGDPLLFKRKEKFDSAYPCGNSLAYHLLYQLDLVRGSNEFAPNLDENEAVMAPLIQRHPTVATHFISGWMDRQATQLHVTVIGAELAQSLVRPLLSQLVSFPYPVVTLAVNNRTAPVLRNLGSIVPEHITENTTIQYQVCADGTCYPPVHTVNQVMEILRSATR